MMYRFSAAAALAIGLLATSAARAATPAVPSGGHPRLFMDATRLAAYSAKAGVAKSAAASMVSACQDAIDHPSNYTDRGGADSGDWPTNAMSCAFAYMVTQQSKYLAPAITYWKAALNDDQNMGDGLGCTTANMNIDWTKWNGDGSPPANVITITHDTDYPMRWYGPEVSLVYDWLYSAPGVDDALRTQTRTCLTAWMDFYTAKGYHANEPGANYNAGYVIGKTLAAIAIGNDGGADGHLWTETNNDVFGKLLIGQGLAGASGAVGTPAGVMVGGDWGEGWQYGPLSVAEYAAAARALEENGASLPDMDSWINSVIVRYIYSTLPTMDGSFAGIGDFDAGTIYQTPEANVIDAVLLGTSSDQAASWAQYMKDQQKPTGSTFFWNVLAETRQATGQDYRTQTPAPALWYLARGTRTMYVRTSWDPSAFWSVFASAPDVNSDHQHFAAGHFVLNRGGDPLIVDSSNYGEPDTRETNAVAADSSGLMGDYQGTQTPWSKAELLWARGTNDAVFAARSDFAHAFDFNGTPSAIPYAHRDWTFLPEGEIVTIDRVQTGAASRNMRVAFHANTGGKMGLSNGVASGVAGGSAVAIHAVSLSGGSPAVSQPNVGSCNIGCNYPCGACDAARFAVDEYNVSVPGPSALAIHVIDGLASGEPEAQVGSLNDDNYDPAPKQNAGVIGAAVFRNMKQSYVVASSAAQGAAGSTMTYGVPGGSAGRHIVYDAPEASDGTSAVTASATSGRCVVSIVAGSGGGVAGHPLMFQVGAASDGCKVSADTDVTAGTPPPGGGVTPIPGTGGNTANTGGGGGGSRGGNPGTGAGPGATGNSTVTAGCGCDVGSRKGSSALLIIVGGLALARHLTSRRRKR
jgi:hypothetical protein